MKNLLAADLVRLHRNRIFWVEMLIITGEIILMHLKVFFLDGRRVPLDGFFLYPIKELGVYIAVFADIFLGTEYKNNTIRNKFMGGCSRPKIYLSFLISCFAAGLFFYLDFILTACILGLPLRSGFLMSPLRLLTLLIPAIMLIGAFSSLSTMAAMLASGRFILAVPGYVLLWLMASLAASGLNAPQIYDNSTQGFVGSPLPADGILRTLCRFLWDFLPTAQSMQLEAGQVAQPLRLSLYSGIIMLGATLTGILLFRRKDIV